MQTHRIVWFAYSKRHPCFKLAFYYLKIIALNLMKSNLKGFIWGGTFQHGICSPLYHMDQGLYITVITSVGTVPELLGLINSVLQELIWINTK